MFRRFFAYLADLFFPPVPEPEPVPPPKPVPPPTPVPEPKPVPKPDPAYDQWVYDILTMHNKARGGGPDRALRLSPELMDAAQGMLMGAAQSHSVWMTTNGMSHTADRQAGRSPADRAKKAGYPSGFVGENIAYGQRDAKHVFDTWYKSPGHHRNIMNRNYNEVGFGMARDGRGVIYWTTVFGKSVAGASWIEQQNEDVWAETMFETLNPPGIAEPTVLAEADIAAYCAAHSLDLIGPSVVNYPRGFAADPVASYDRIVAHQHTTTTGELLRPSIVVEVGVEQMLAWRNQRDKNANTAPRS